MYYRTFIYFINIHIDCNETNPCPYPISIRDPKSVIRHP